ncbi:hypothetical protein ITJ64_02500 [Herbiconiux sp. VKM Ac-1786]|uniref:hypothetical protein n=1 Tax=Herbiconiux sp. VKM Ac-1786 TaxID=2783824 RepID=UPI00188AB8E9|nr:hypothetical protein [Herbiconiux sp. VKM Ac-1786]MBF4571377.1 hypothetical protein [Herbiconiux sp. VKM Ac-1786]
MLINETHSPTRPAGTALGLAIAAPIASVVVALLSLALGADGAPAGGFAAPVLQLVLVVALLAVSTHLAVRTLRGRVVGRPRTLAVVALVVDALVVLTFVAPLAYSLATLNQ